jgi:hypothetical protein
MIKFVVILTAAISLNFTLSFSEYLGLKSSNKSEEIQIIFSESPIGVESGQPVYPIETKVFIKSNEEKKFIISINGNAELNENGSFFEITKFINSQADTYTVVIESMNQNRSTHRVFGFTIQ